MKTILKKLPPYSIIIATKGRTKQQVVEQESHVQTKYSQQLKTKKTQLMDEEIEIFDLKFVRRRVSKLMDLGGC